MSALAIEPMSASDVAAVLTIDLSSFAAAEVGAGDEPVAVVRERQLREELARPWAHLWVARAGSEVLGYVLAWLVAGDEVHLLNVAVAPTRRREGIGRALVQEVLAFARARAAKTVLLEVRAGNLPALGLYVGFGFETVRRRVRYYDDGEDALEMLLSLG